MQYSLPYILLLVFILGIATLQLGLPLEEKSRKYINFLVVIVYILFFGFRGFIATDWMNYYIFFKDLHTDIAVTFKGRSFETGFLLYSIIIKKFFTSYEGFQLINTLTNICLLHIFFRKNLATKYYALGFAVFLVFNGSILEINLLRNFKAVLIFLLALPYIVQRKPIQYFTLITIALLFHWSSIVFYPLYFFLHKKIPIKFFLITFIAGVIIYLFKIQYITPILKLFATFLPLEISQKILSYMSSTYFTRSYGFTFGFFERALMTFFLLFYYSKITANRSNILFVNGFFVFLSLFLFCSEITIVLERVAANFAYSYWILIPTIIQKAERNTKPIVTFFFALILIAKMHVLMNGILYEYDSFLFGNSKSYEQRLDIYTKNRKEIEKK